MSCGEMDQNLRRKYRGHWLVCPKGHLNSPNAKECAKCGSTDLVKESERKIYDVVKRGGE